jgi:hypothetical protein
VTNPEKVVAIHFIILDDRRISAKNIAENLAICRETVGYNIHESLDMRNLSAKWVPNVSMLIRSGIQCLLHKQISNEFCGILWVFSTVSLLWMKLGSIYIYDPETKEKFK